MSTPTETMAWLAAQFRDRANEDGEAHTIADAAQVEAAKESFSEALEALKATEASLVLVVGEPPKVRDPADADRQPTRHAAWRAIDAARAIIAKAGADIVPTGFDNAIREAQDRREGDLARRIMAERRMAVALVDRALRDGYSVSVNDGEEWVVNRSKDRATILGAMFSSDEDVVRLNKDHDTSVGRFWFVYGNSGWDVVSDYSDNPICNAIWEETLRPLSDDIEAGR